jgi:hypothetical protein
MRISVFFPVIALLAIACAHQTSVTAIAVEPRGSEGTLAKTTGEVRSEDKASEPQSQVAASETASVSAVPLVECHPDYEMTRDDGPFTYADDGSWVRAELYGRPLSTRTASVVLFSETDERMFTFGALRIDFRDPAVNRETRLINWVRDDFLKSADRYVVSKIQDVTGSSGAAKYFTFEERVKPRPKAKKRRGKSVERPLPLQYGLAYVRRLSDDPSDTATLLVRAYWRHSTDRGDIATREGLIAMAESIRRASSAAPPSKAP